MSIIIIGAGQIGQFIASKLSSENKDVFIIEKDDQKIAEISDELDVQIIQGNGASIEALNQAGIKNAQMLIAVTDSDEVNLLSCMISNLQSSAPVKIARVRNPEFYHMQDKEILKKLNINMVFNPDKEAADAILRILSVPGSIEVLNFFGGKMKLVGVKARESKITNIPLEKLESLRGNKKLLISTILRDGRIIIPSGKNQILPGDLVYFVTESDNIEYIMNLANIKYKTIKRVMINGGNYIGLYLAKILEKNDVQVKVIESDSAACSKLVRNLDKSIVLNNSATDQDFLLQENVKDMDAFISVTADDENNILTSLLAKRLGTPWVISLTNEISYIPLITTIGVDVAINPRLITNSSILHFIRQGNVLSVSSLQEDIEILEIETLATSDIVNMPIKKAKIPKDSLILCLERNGEVIIVDGNTVIQPGDKVIIQASTKAIPKIEKLFTVKLEYF